MDLETNRALPAGEISPKSGGHRGGGKHGQRGVLEAEGSFLGVFRSVKRAKTRQLGLVALV